MVTCALCHLRLAANAHVDVRTLLVQRLENTATLRLELVGGFGIAYVVNRAADDSRQINILLGGHLAGYEYLTGGNHCLAGYVSRRVKSKKIVQNSVADLVSDFVGVSFGH